MLIIIIWTAYKKTIKNAFTNLGVVDGDGGGGVGGSGKLFFSTHFTVIADFIYELVERVESKSIISLIITML